MISATDRHLQYSGPFCGVPVTNVALGVAGARIVMSMATEVFLTVQARAATWSCSRIQDVARTATWSCRRVMDVARAVAGARISNQDHSRGRGPNTPTLL